MTNKRYLGRNLLGVTAFGLLTSTAVGCLAGYSLSKNDRFQEEPKIVEKVIREAIPIKPEFSFTHMGTNPDGSDIFRYDVWHTDAEIVERIAEAFNEFDKQNGDRYDDISGAQIVRHNGKPLKEVRLATRAYVLANKKKGKPKEVSSKKPEEIIPPKQFSQAKKPEDVTFAILINNDNERRHMNNLESAYTVLSVNGVNTCNIYTISNFNSPISCFNNDGSLDRTILAPSTVNGMEITIQNLRSRLQETGSKRKKLFIYSTGHGDKEGISLDDGIFSYENLRRKLDGTDIDFVLGISDTCHGGGFPESFRRFSKKGLFWSPFDSQNTGKCRFVTPHFWDLVGKGVSYDLNGDGITSLSELAMFLDGVYVVANDFGRPLTGKEVEILRRDSLQDFKERGYKNPEYVESVVVATGGVYDATFDGRIIRKKRTQGAEESLVREQNNSPKINDIVELTPENYNQEVKQSKIPVFVDIYATWCIPCQYLSRELDKIKDNYAGRVKFGKIDADRASNFLVREEPKFTSLPTILFYRDGRKVGMEVGPRESSELEELIRDNLKVNPY